MEKSQIESLRKRVAQETELDPDEVYAQALLAALEKPLVLSEPVVVDGLRAYLRQYPIVPQIAYPADKEYLWRVPLIDSLHPVADKNGVVYISNKALVWTTGWPRNRMGRVLKRMGFAQKRLRVHYPKRRIDTVASCWVVPDELGPEIMGIRTTSRIDIPPKKLMEIFEWYRCNWAPVLYENGSTDLVKLAEPRPAAGYQYILEGQEPWWDSEYDDVRDYYAESFVGSWEVADREITVGGRPFALVRNAKAWRGGGWLWGWFCEAISYGPGGEQLYQSEHWESYPGVYPVLYENWRIFESSGA